MLPFCRLGRFPWCCCPWTRTRTRRVRGLRGPLVTLAVLAAALRVGPVRADSVLSFVYTPAPRAQIAIWIEDAKGQFLATVALTEAVAFRGIGNRPGASEMNSGYRWPYGRREGVLPIWAHRRASAPGAKLFPRVIYQSRVEGFASRTASDQSPDAYYCLQFDSSKAEQDQLDAVSCATPFSSDKGCYLTTKDLSAHYAEPYEAQKGQGIRQPMPLNSVYPPRMDVKRCGADQGCFDTADVDRFVTDTRAVMPEIDAITIATPPGDLQQRVLFSVPKDWPSGAYAAFIEVNVEGDYNARWNKDTYPTASTPVDDWDQYTQMYGYAYRGQPSLVWKVTFNLPGSGQADVAASTADPVGRSSWDVWSSDYGKLEPISFDASDPHAISNTVAHSGASRLAASAMGQRFALSSLSAAMPTKPPVGTGEAGTNSQGGVGGSTAGSGAAGAAGAAVIGSAAGTGGADGSPGAPAVSPVGPVEDLLLQPDGNRLYTHTWVRLRMRAAWSELPLHAYEVRVATEPISDDDSFIRNGRQAKTAAQDPEGLSLPTAVPAGNWIEAGVGDLFAETHYYIAVRATDQLNRHGPIKVAEITTTTRQFATVTPCFVASVAYGSPLANEVGALRRVRDRYLLPQTFGRAWVAEYYRVGAHAAAWIRPHSALRTALRAMLTPLVRLAHALD